MRLQLPGRAVPRLVLRPERRHRLQLRPEQPVPLAGQPQTVSSTAASHHSASGGELYVHADAKALLVAHIYYCCSACRRRKPGPQRSSRRCWRGSSRCLRHTGRQSACRSSDHTDNVAGVAAAALARYARMSGLPTAAARQSTDSLPSAVASINGSGEHGWPDFRLSPDPMCRRGFQHMYGRRSYQVVSMTADVG